MNGCKKNGQASKTITALKQFARKLHWLLPPFISSTFSRACPHRRVFQLMLGLNCKHAHDRCKLRKPSLMVAGVYMITCICDIKFVIATYCLPYPMRTHEGKVPHMRFCFQLHRDHEHVYNRTPNSIERRGVISMHEEMRSI